MGTLTSNFQKLHLVGKGDSNPIGLGRRPLQLVNFTGSRVHTNGINPIRRSQSRQFPNKSLSIIPSRTNMRGTMRSPSNGIDTATMPLELSHRCSGRTNIQNHNFITIHQNSGHIPKVLFVPSQTEQRGIRVRTLVDNGGMLFVSEIKDSNGTVSGDGSENASFTPSDVVYLFIVGDELRFNEGAFDVPNGAGGVDAGSADAVRVDVVPVEGGERGAELAGLAVVEEGEGVDGVLAELPEAEVVAGGGEEVGGGGGGGRRVVAAGMEHDFGGRVRVVEGEGRVWGNGEGFGVEREDVDAVGVFFDEASDGDSVGVCWGHRHGVDWVRGFVGY